MIERPGIQRLLADQRFTGKSDDEIVAYNFDFQTLNVCYELRVAREGGLIDVAVADRFLRGNLDVLRGRRAAVLDILSWNRGYDPAFRSAVERLSRATTSSALISNELRPRLMMLRPRR